MRKAIYEEVEILEHAENAHGDAVCHRKVRFANKAALRFEYLPFDFEKLVVFRWNDLLALMLNCLCHSALPFYDGEAPSLRIAATVAVSRL